MKKEKLIYSMDDMVKLDTTPCLNLPELKEECCLVPKTGEPYMLFVCSPTDKPTTGCPNCGSIDFTRDGVGDQPRLVHDVNVGITHVDILLQSARYKCKDCGARFRHVYNSIPPDRNVTDRLYEQICMEAFTRPFTDVASEHGYTEGTVRNFFDEYAAEMEAMRPKIKAPEVLGIDEKHIVHEMRAVFIDIKTGRLLEMTPNNKVNDIIGTITRMEGYENIRLITTDMANGYRSYIHEYLPHVKIIVDKYHVYQDLYRKITKTKKEITTYVKEKIQKNENASERERLLSVLNLLTRNAYIFKFGKKKLLEKPSRIQILADACKTFPEFNHLRLIKEGFERIYECKNREDAEKVYQEWVALIPPTGKRKEAAWEEKYGVDAGLFKELKGFYRTTQSWHEEILGYFDEDCQYTNAASEGTNRMIQSINDQGSGYGFKRLRAKALYWSNVKSAVAYDFVDKSIPIYQKQKRTQRSSGSMDMCCMVNPIFQIMQEMKAEKTVIGYRNEKSVQQVAGEEHKPLSVLSYYRNSDLFDFEEADNSAD